MKKFVEVSILPIGTNEISIRKYIKEFVSILRNKGEKIHVNAMSTIIETNNLKRTIESILEAHEKMFKLGLKRLVLEIKIDDRRDKEQNYEDRIKDI